MDEMLKGLEGVVCYLDDVLIAGASIEECQTRVDAALARFQLHGVRVKQDKSKTVEKLRSIFAAFGLLEEVVTDNGPQFVSSEFAAFLSSNGIRHKTTPPYHPASNGAAERLVQTVKRNLEKQLKDEKRMGISRSIQHRVDLVSLPLPEHSMCCNWENPGRVVLVMDSKDAANVAAP
ncbi:hypothetical protein MTO96_035820 [Rhipicephalus appendiculatus]